MSDTMVLSGASAEGAARVREVATPGMVTLKGDLASAAVAKVVLYLTGCAMPAPRRIVQEGSHRVAWMAPDEILLILPREAVGGAVGQIATSLSGEHHLAADVSDMRAMFRIETGVAARETLAKLCPVDLAPGVFETGEMRRTRLAQIPAAFWLEDDGFTLVCFRSVAQYAFDVLRQAAAEDAAVGYFADA